MFYHIYHSHVGSCNLSSIRIILYSAAEAQELLILGRWGSISSLWTLAVLKQNDDHTISITYSRKSLWPDAQEAALPALPLAVSSDARRLQRLGLCGLISLRGSPESTQKPAQSFTIQDLLPCNEIL